MPTVLIVAASPLDQNRLSLNREVRNIKRALERSQNRKNWQIESNEACTVEDLRRSLLDYQPTILHFSGHGGGEKGLCFEDDQGSTHYTRAAPLAKLLHHFKEQIKCVVLNACYSEVQADAIRQQIDCVVGMQKSIDDEAASKFAVAFYDAVFAGTSFRTAFNLGSSAVDLHNLPDGDAPIFLTSPQLGGLDFVYTEIIPEIENLLHAYRNTPFAERYRFTTQGEGLAEQIKRHYGGDSFFPVNKVAVLSSQQIDERHWVVYARFEVFGGTVHDGRYYLTKNGESLKIDWEASVGFWSKPLKTYLALGSAEPVVARVSAELENFYAVPFWEKVTYQSVALKNIGGHRLYGYVARAGVVYEELMSILSDGKSHDITVEIINLSENTEYPLIVGILSHTWMLPAT